ncbi:uncharacterized protein LOC135151649 [Daucus carota subsp. sativus]
MDAHDHLAVVDGSKMTWNVRVRVTRIWPSTIPNGVIVRWNLLLLDSENTHVHASTTPEIWIQFQNLINEGVVCMVRNFSVIPANGIFRPVLHPRQIAFTEATRINVIPEEEFTIQMHRFEIIPLEDLQEHVVEGNPNWLNEFSIDVMGMVEDLEPIQESQTNHGPVEIIKFTIYDGSVRHKVHISGPFNPDALSLYDDQFANPKIVIMASTRISEFRGTIKITNLSSTKIYVNLECPEVTTFRHWLINDGFMEFWPII